MSLWKEATAMSTRPTVCFCTPSVMMLANSTLLLNRYGMDECPEPVSCPVCLSSQQGGGWEGGGGEEAGMLMEGAHTHLGLARHGGAVVHLQ